ncbi:MAG: hypothetical protein IJ519_04000 [Clostridia bacterium]|nr:hypothetical protein [Clostridia bacterium]
MFGYVKPEVKELRVKEHTTYKAIYCGLCKATGESVTCSARFALSYDFVFLALLRMALTGEVPDFDTGRCMAHPVKKRPYAKGASALEYSAKASALLTYYKIEDDITDSRGMKRLKYKLALPHGRRAKKKARGLEGLEESIRTHLTALSALEAKREASADAPAEIFGLLLADVGSYGLEGGAARIAAEVCHRVGKWIYFADALDDYESDKESGSYNPLLMAYPDDPDTAREHMLFAMAAERNRALDALALADIADGGLKNILENILTLGLSAEERKLEKVNEGSL